MIRSSNFSLPLLSAKASETNSNSFSTHAVKILRRRTGKEERVNQWETLTELWQIEKQESKVAGKSQRWWRLRKKEGRKRKMKKEREKLGKKNLGGPPIRVLSQSLWKVQGRVGFRWPSSCALLELDRVCWVADTQFIYRNKEKDTFTTYFCVRNKPEGKKDKKKKKLSAFYGVSAALCMCAVRVCTICVWKGERNERDSNFDQTLSASPSDSTMWLDRAQSRLRLGPVGLFHLAVEIPWKKWRLVKKNISLSSKKTW